MLVQIIFTKLACGHNHDTGIIARRLKFWKIITFVTVCLIKLFKQIIIFLMKNFLRTILKISETICNLHRNIYCLNDLFKNLENYRRYRGDRGKADPLSP